MTVTSVTAAEQAKSDFDRRGIAALAWGGLRGGSSLAFAMTLNVESKHSVTILSMAYAVVLSSIIGHGLSRSCVFRFLFRGRGGGENGDGDGVTMRTSHIEREGQFVAAVSTALSQSPQLANMLADQGVGLDWQHRAITESRAGSTSSGRQARSVPPDHRTDDGGGGDDGEGPPLLITTTPRRDDDDGGGGDFFWERRSVQSEAGRGCDVDQHGAPNSGSGSYMYRVPHNTPRSASRRCPVHHRRGRSQQQQQQHPPPPRFEGDGSACCSPCSSVGSAALSNSQGRWTNCGRKSNDGSAPPSMVASARHPPSTPLRSPTPSPYPPRSSEQRDLGRGPVSSRRRLRRREGSYQQYYSHTGGGMAATAAAVNAAAALVGSYPPPRGLPHYRGLLSTMSTGLVENGKSAGAPLTQQQQQQQEHRRPSPIWSTQSTTSSRNLNEALLGGSRGLSSSTINSSDSSRSSTANSSSTDDNDCGGEQQSAKKRRRGCNAAKGGGGVEEEAARAIASVRMDGAPMQKNNDDDGDRGQEFHYAVLPDDASSDAGSHLATPLLRTAAVGAAKHPPTMSTTSSTSPAEDDRDI